MVEILLWAAVALLVVLIVLVTRLRPASFREDAERIERTVREENRSARGEAAGTFSRFQTELKDDLIRQESRSREDFKMLAESLGERMDKMALFLKEQNEAVSKALKENTLTLETKLQHIREDNEKQLERMRVTVDEKLQNTLEKRLTESFKRVSDQLESVFKGLGEMQTLASDVGDLKKVLSNVKVRGTWGEYQLGNILEQMLAPDQYEQNAHPNPSRAGAVVEYAVKLPGKDDNEKSVYLPIDSKFPMEDYQSLILASESGDAAAVELARRNLMNRIKTFAKDICEKYVEPPYTTNFAIMFLPVEGLYAEVLREVGVFEELQTKYKVTVTGPTTLAAFISSLQMGFHTLAIEKKSAAIWQTLSAVKTEFGKFGDNLGKAYRQISLAQKTIGELNTTRVSAINRKLRSLETLEDARAAEILELEEPYEEDTEENSEE